MARLHYFQRYSSKENVVTNNTLLLFSQMYQESPELLENLLNDLTEGPPLRIGPVFGQQVRGKKSVPDGVLHQSSFRILIETKLGDDVYVSQLKRHLGAFGRDDSKILIVLTGRSVNKGVRQEFGKTLKAHNESSHARVAVAWVTFEELIEGIRQVIGDRHYELTDLVEDFQEYCGQSGLLPREEYRLRAVPCGQSFDENMRFGVYYEPPGRAATPYRYLGIYKNKAIRGIGRVAQKVEADIEEGRVRVDPAAEELESEIADRILRTVQAAKEDKGWDLTSGHQFIILENLQPTLYRKTTSGGMRGMKYFDLGRVLDTTELPPLDEIAGLLREETW